MLPHICIAADEISRCASAAAAFAAAGATEYGLPTLLTAGDFAATVSHAEDSSRAVLATAIRLGIPAPGFSTAIAYYDALRRLPAALVQGQRDYFGAHTYPRTDRDGAFHTAWAEPSRPENMM